VWLSKHPDWNETTKGSYSLRQAQTKKVQNFHQKEKVWFSFCFRFQALGSFVASNHTSDPAETDNNSGVAESNLSSAIQYMALYPLTTVTLPTTARSMPQIDYSIQQVLHTIIQCAVTLTTQLHVGISMLKASSTNCPNSNHWFTPSTMILFCFWNVAIWFNLWPGNPTYQLLYFSQRQTLPWGWSHDYYLRYNSCYSCQCIYSCCL